MSNKVLDIVDFSLFHKINNAKFWSANLDQNYHPSGFFNEESIGIVYSQGVINTTDYYPILLKEWFFILNRGGYLIIDYIPNKTIGFNDMEKIFWWLFRRKYELIYHGKSSNSDKNIKKIPKLKEDIPIINSQDMQRFVCKKVESTKINGDSIDKWTFGIVSNGERRDWVDSCIESIRKQHIPECEIIICGTYFGDECDDLRLFSA